VSIQFGRDICGELSDAEQREWLVTNGLGGYACGTLSGLFTRQYHGLLVAALTPPLGRTVLLAKLDETVHYAQQSYELRTNRWTDGTIAPHGYRQIERFQLDGTTPVWHYACADALLEKRIWMQPGANTTHIRYTLNRGTEPLYLSLKALVNYRAVSLPTVDPLPPLLTPAQQQAVVNTCAKMLLTSHGLRSLAPTHPDDAGHYRGDPYQRDRTYHQGMVWGWLMGAFVQAHLRVYCDPGTALTFLESIADQLRFGCVGTLSEIFDGDSPFSSRGAFAQAWTVAEALRAWRLVQERLISRSSIQ